MSRIVALVPMRHDSERVPGKNWREFAGEPLYVRIVESLSSCPLIDEIVIDTDSPVIRDGVAGQFEHVRVIDRPEHLRAGTTPMNEVLLHDIEEIDADYYLQTHSTNPLLRSATIQRAIDSFLGAREHHDSLFSVTRLQARLYDSEGRAINHSPTRLERTQDLPPVFEENSNLYLFDAETLRATGSRIGRTPMMFEIDRAEAWDIDAELDFVIAEWLYEREASR